MNNPNRYVVKLSALGKDGTRVDVTLPTGRMSFADAVEVNSWLIQKGVMAWIEAA